MGRSRTEPPEAHIHFTTHMYAGWAVPARAYGTCAHNTGCPI